ncbi:hypothetical protein [Candidatus Nitrospira nitrosa]|uniref:hypothetical protein n=1 Tax=Candidatus Nitrospira nitrosa TaxID=1742972 RepID=UPI001147A30D|nr:hypothetical protein [Candidatus Nitrospira nitrosa]
MIGVGRLDLPRVLQIKEGSRIVQINAGGNSEPGNGRELHRFSGSFGGGSLGQCLAERLFDDGRHRFDDAVGQAFSRFEELVIQ